MKAALIKNLNTKLRNGVGNLILAILTISIAVGLTACAAKDNLSISEFSVGNIDLSANPGVGVELAYENDSFIVFYGYFGLFGYDLERMKITFSFDFEKAFGKPGSVQGSHGIAVDVSGDSKTIMLYDYDVETETRGETFYIDLEALTYSRGEYRPLENSFLPDEAVGYIKTTTKIGTLQYIRDMKVWQLFE